MVRNKSFHFISSLSVSIHWLVPTDTVHKVELVEFYLNSISADFDGSIFFLKDSFSNIDKISWHSIRKYCAAQRKKK